MKHLFLITFIFIAVFASAQNTRFRMAGTSPGFSIVNDSTYQGTVNLHPDQTGNGFIATAIVDTMNLFTGSAQLYRIDSVWSKAFSSATVRLVEISPTNGKPIGQFVIFNPDGKETIPVTPLATSTTSGMTLQLQAACISWNANKGVDSGGSPTGPAGGDLTGTYPNPTIANNAVDSTNISTGGIGNTDLQNGIVTVNKIGADAVTADKIGAGEVGASELAATAVTAGSYTAADITVDEDGRITAAANGSGGSGIDTLASYAALDAYNGSSFLVYLNDFYSSTGGGGSGQKWKVRGGLWRRGANPGFVDGGTSRLASNGRYWQRVFDRVNFLPEFFAVDSANWNVGSYIYFDGAEAIQAASTTAYNNYRAGTANKGESSASIVLSPGKTYYQSIGINLKENQNLIGNNARIKKKNAVTTTSTGAATSGGNTVTVASTTGFRIGMLIFVASGNANDQHAGEFMAISGISGLTITVSGTWARTIASGATVASHCGHIGITATTLEIGTGRIEDVILDGNQANNNTNYDWQTQTAIGATGSIDVHISRVHFLDQTGDCILLGSGIVKDCTAKRCWSTFTHYASFEIEDGRKGLRIENCDIDSICLATNAIQGHATGAFENSGFARWQWIENCRVTNCSEAVFGQQTSEDGQFWADRVYAKSCNGITASQNTNACIDNIQISNSEFINCGDLLMAGGGSIYALPAFSIQGVKILNNRFTNSRMVASGFKEAKIKGNTWVWTPGYFANYTVATANGAAIDFTSNWYQLEFEDNLVMGDTVFDADIINGVILGLSNGQIKDTLLGGVVINRLDRTRCYLKNNKISEFKRPISSVITGTPPAGTTVSEWYIWDNHLIGNRNKNNYSTSGDYLCSFPPGIDFRYNIVEHQAETLDTVRVRFWGIDNTADTAYFAGSTIKNNSFVRTSIQSGYDATDNNYNNVITDNEVSFPIWNFNPTKNYVLRNDIINVSMLPAMTNRKPKRTIFSQLTDE